jgi:hypothetical protein
LAQVELKKMRLATFTGPALTAAAGPHVVHVGTTGVSLTIDVASQVGVSAQMSLLSNVAPRIARHHLPLHPQTAFRFSINLNGGASPAVAIANPQLSEELIPAASKQCGWGEKTGLCTSFGALLAGQDGSWTMYDSSNTTVLESTAPPSSDAHGQGGVVLRVSSPLSPLQDLPGQVMALRGRLRAAAVLPLASTDTALQRVP